MKLQLTGCIFIWVALLRHAAFGQVAIPGNYLLELDKHLDSTHLTFYPSIDIAAVNSGLSWIHPLAKASFNSRYPRSYNDGPIWKGKGLTTELHVGAAGKRGKLTWVINPTLFFSQNTGFSLSDSINPSRNRYNYQLSDNIDWVQRYGDQPYFYLHPGQSEVNVNFGKLSVALSTQNYSLGPSNFNPILLSRNAGGFPHVKVQWDHRHLKIKKKDLGHVQVQLIHGLVRESNYYDSDSGNDFRYFNVFSFAYQPSFLKELTLGFNRVMYKNTLFFKARDLLAPFLILDDGSRPNQSSVPNDTFDGLASFTMDWNFTEVGFRAYLEYARNDFTGGIRNLLLEPDAGQRAYTLGFEKVFEIDAGRKLVFQYEHNNLARGPVLLYRDADQSYYTHYINRHGYTSNGQIIGAGIGPGSTSDNLGIKFERKMKSIGLLVQRIEMNRDYFNKNIQSVGLHDQEYTVQINGLFRKKGFDLLAEIGYSYNFNRYYIDDSRNLMMACGAILRLGDN